MEIVIHGKRGGTKRLNVRTIPQLETALASVRPGFDQKHEQLLLLGSFIAERLVEIQDALEGRSRRRSARAPSAWNRFFAEGMKAGKAPTVIAREWRERKARAA